MSTESPEFRLQAIRLRRLEISATLARWKSEWLNKAISRTLAERSELEAEAAELAFEERQIGTDAALAKVARKRAENASVLAVLCRLLQERGLGDVITEAEERSAEERAAVAAEDGGA